MKTIKKFFLDPLCTSKFKFKLIILIALVLPNSPTFSQVLPDGFEKTIIAQGLKLPLAMASAPDNRIFFSEKNGNIRVVKKDVLLTKPAAKIPTDSLGSETGVAGIIFDPEFAQNGFIYLYYTVPADSLKSRVGRISRFKVHKDSISLLSEKILLDMPLPNANFIGGAMAFGKDGMLYVATGYNNSPVSQDLNNYFGKLIRINKKTGIGPKDNPFKGSEAASRIWGYGLRNPYGLSVNDDGRILLIDVGDKLYEEVNDVTKKGKNFGWPLAEGVSGNSNFADPIFTYHTTSIASDTAGCAITGGVFYNPRCSNFPKKYNNKFFILDFCNQWINTLDINNSKKIQVNNFASKVSGYSYSLHMSPDGNLYYFNLSATGGILNKISYNKPNNSIQSREESIYDSNSDLKVVRVFPNPTSGKCLISVPENTEQCKISVMNSYGTIVYESKNIELTQEVDLSELEKGVYFFNVLKDGELNVIKVVKQ